MSDSDLAQKIASSDMLFIILMNNILSFEKFTSLLFSECLYEFVEEFLGMPI